MIEQAHKLSIVGYGLGNLGSIQNMYKKLGIRTEIAETPAAVLEADKLVLPGVGAFDEGMTGLRAAGLVDPIIQKAAEGTPILGVCLGMHLMTDASEEGVETGLGLIHARVKRFTPPEGSELKVPHMGWNEVEASRGDELLSGLLQEGEERSRFYFVHSYYVECRDRSDVFLEATHGIKFDVAFRRDNIMGVQFHPEKSHRFGMQILKNFYELPNAIHQSHPMPAVPQWQSCKNH